MAKSKPEALTAERIRQAACPAGVSRAVMWDSVQPGLAVRLYATGRKSFVFVYRLQGAGRSLSPRWLNLGSCDAVSLRDARNVARVAAGKVASGADPAAERQRERQQERARLSNALDAYAVDMDRRGVVKASETISVLRRGLRQPLGDMDLADVTLPIIIQRIEAVRADGRPGAAQSLRACASVFLSWCAAQGLMAVNPMVGWRKPRATRAERLARTEAATSSPVLQDHEMALFWKAAEAQGFPFGPYLQTLLLTGQRRTETARARWTDMNLDTGTWSIPPEHAKSGRPHMVPLSSDLVTILQSMPRVHGNPYVFPGRDGVAMSGWAKRTRSFRAAAAGIERIELHDMRRSMRTGLARLGVEPHVAERLLSHKVGNALDEAYQHHVYWTEHVEAAGRWASHVMACVRTHTAPSG